MMDITHEESVRLQNLAHSLKDRTQTEMPKYLCHKQVWALKIEDIKDPTVPGNESDGSRIIVPADAGFAHDPVDELMCLLAHRAVHVACKRCK